jgi:sec-independent protein translocase protein TatC
MDDLVKSARSALTRAELPGMSLIEHLEELRKRVIHSAVYLVIGFAVAYAFHERLYGFIQAPLDELHIPLNFTHPTDGLTLYLKTSFGGGAILASPFVLFQLWLFISPGMYAHEKRYVWPFMSATIGLFLAGAYFGYRWVLPGAIRVLVLEYGHRFHPILTIEDYTGFFLAIILGLGIAFELPILMFFLALFGNRGCQVSPPQLQIRHHPYLRNCGCGLPSSRPVEHVPLRLSPAGSLLARSRSGLPRPPIAQEIEA